MNDLHLDSLTLSDGPPRVILVNGSLFSSDALKRMSLKEMSLAAGKLEAVRWKVGMHDSDLHNFMFTFRSIARYLLRTLAVGEARDNGDKEELHKKIQASFGNDIQYDVQNFEYIQEMLSEVDILKLDDDFLKARFDQLDPDQQKAFSAGPSATYFVNGVYVTHRDATSASNLEELVYQYKMSRRRNIPTTSTPSPENICFDIVEKFMTFLNNKEVVSLNVRNILATDLKYIRLVKELTLDCHARMKAFMKR